MNKRHKHTMFSRVIYSSLNIVILWIKFSEAVPPDYCLHSLNTSDCKGPPTPVFYYYKPGSRCEIALWRGCPTYNKFDDEYLCSHHCIYKFIKTNGIIKEDTTVYIDQCSKQISESNCKDQKHSIVYTYNYDEQDCLPIAWGDCKSPNIFREKQECVDTCVPDWQGDIKNLTVDEYKEIEQLLDEVNEVNETDIHSEVKPLIKLKATTTEKIDTTATATTAVPTTVSDVPSVQSTMESVLHTVTTELAETTTTASTTTTTVTTLQSTADDYIQDVVLP